jgi:hypothetical protein
MRPKFSVIRYYSVTMLLHYGEPIATAPFFKIPWKGNASDLAGCRDWRFLPEDETRQCDHYIIEELKAKSAQRENRREDKSVADESREQYLPSWELYDKIDRRKDILRNRKRLTGPQNEPPIIPALASTTSEWD